MKTKVVATIFIVLLAAPAAIFAGAARAATKTPFYYGVWLPFWKSQDGAADIAVNLNALHEVSPFSYELSSSGALIDDLRIGNGSWDAWFGAVRDAGVRIIPTIAWFDTPNIYKLLSNAKKRQAEEDTIAALVKSEKFDGIDIDFEGMTSSTKPYYSLFIYGLALRLHPVGKALACTVVPRTPVGSLYDSNPLPAVQYAEDYAVLNKYCDEVRVMAYDQGTIDIKLDASKGNGRLYAPTADPAWVEKVIKNTITTISPKKVILGIPTYGYEYQVSWNMGATTYERVRSFTFFQAMDRADSLGIAPYRNNAGELSFTFASSTHINNVGPALTSIVASTLPAALATANPNTSTTFFASFSDVQSTADKIALAKKYGLRGAMLFKADGDLDPATWGVMH
ncbi:MAG: glycosyl hydrolase family 18 protein [Minisyncoccia bacterium]